MKIHDYQVLQREADGKARVTLDDGQILELPVGGPYEVAGAHDVMVGDLWVLAGQSNMEGLGDIVDVETPSPLVHSLQSREEWAIAEEPLHWLGESPRVVHHHLWGRAELPAEPDPRDPNRSKGAGLGLTFAKERVERTGVPIGLIPSAHGGTSMQQWDPKLRDQGGASLYGATHARVQSAGGKVAGILWYQGESDTNPDDHPRYTERMTELIHAFRQDFGQPELPFYYVQLGPFACEIGETESASWNAVREAQRLLEGQIAHTAMASAIDLELDDVIHIGTQGLKRLGRRMARLTEGRHAPSVAQITRSADGMQIRVSYDHVQDSLKAFGRPAGFSLRSQAGKDLMRIYKTTLEGNTAVLHLTDANLPAGTELWYGWGFLPYCNVTDAADAAVPAFGPLLVPAA